MRARYVENMISLLLLLFGKQFKLKTWNFGFNFTAIVTNASSKMSCERSEASSLYTNYYSAYFAIIGQTI